MKNEVQTKRSAARSGALLIAAAAAASADLVFGTGAARGQTAVTANANYSTTVEEGGAFGTTSFEAAGNSANGYPAFGVVAFNASSFTTLASTGVSPSVVLMAPEYISTSTSTLTSAGSVLSLYFGKSPTTGAGLGDYDTANEPSGFDAATFNADLVGSVTYGQVANQVDTIALTLSAGDVQYIDTVLSNTSSSVTTTPGSFEFFLAATSNISAGRFDGNFTNTTTSTFAGATLELTAAPEPTSALLLGLASVPIAFRRRRRFASNLTDTLRTGRCPD